MTSADIDGGGCAKVLNQGVSDALASAAHQWGMEPDLEHTDPVRPRLRLVRDGESSSEPSPLPAGIPHRLLTGDEVAWWLQVPRGALDAWREKGSAPKAYRVGKHLRWRIEDVVTWLEEQAA